MLINGDDSDNSLRGTEQILPGTGEDTLIGGAGNDRLDGRSGFDTLIGGVGDDTYVIQDYAGGENSLLIVGLPIEGATWDPIFSYATGYFQASAYVLGLFANYQPILGDIDHDGLIDTVAIDYHENFDPYLNVAWYGMVFSTWNLGTNLAVGTYAGLNRSNVDIKGSTLGYSDNGLSASLTIHAAEFDYSGAEVTVERFSASFEILNGWFYGPPHAVGTINYNYAPAGPARFDTIVENPDGGNDTVESSLTYALPENVENLTLTGGREIDGTGNELDNVIVGNPVNNVLLGLSGDDRLFGNYGNDQLDGGPGADVLDGGPGNDTYHVDGDDTVVELPDQGNDRVVAAFSYTLPANVEELQLTGNADIDATGNSLDNLLIANAGTNRLIGLGGNDAYEVNSALDVVVEQPGEGIDLVRSGVTYALPGNVENLRLIGVADIDGHGNALDNVLTGNTGTNRLVGYAGNDTYDVVSAGAQVIEQPNEGIDLVRSTVTFRLPAHVENLALVGTGDIDAYGNELDNVLSGSSGVNRMYGGDGNDTYQSVDASDVIVELPDEGIDLVIAVLDVVLSDNVENVTLIGGRAATGNALDNVITGSPYWYENLLTGLSGNDTYILGGQYDRVIEAPYAGIDHVFSAFRFTLPANVENLTLTGSEPMQSSGNELDNVIRGNAGQNEINGAGGDDTLEGGAGDDRLRGGSGDDTALYSGAQADYRITLRADGSLVVADQRNGRNDGADVLEGIELLQFADAVRRVADNHPVLITAAFENRFKPQRLVRLDSLFQAGDIDRDAVVAYQFWDSSPGVETGFISVGGQQQGSLRPVDVDAAGLAGVQFSVGREPDALWVRARDGFGWGAWFELDVVPVNNNAPQASVNDQSAPQGLAVPFVVNPSAVTDPETQIVVSVRDADGDDIRAYRFWDSQGGGSIRIDGSPIAPDTSVDVQAADLGRVTYLAADTPTAELLWLRAYDGETWSAWESWTQRSLRVANSLPSISGPATLTLAPRQWIRVDALGMTFSDPDGDEITAGDVTDGSAGPGSAYLWFKEQDVAQGGTATFVSRADFSGIWLRGGIDAGIDEIRLRVSDGRGYSSVFTLTVTTTAAPNRAPVVVPRDLGVRQGQAIAVAKLFTVTDADGDPALRYRVWDGGVDGGYFSLNGVRQAAQSTVEFATADLVNFDYVAGDAVGAETLWARAFDGIAWGEWQSWRQRTLRATNSAPRILAQARLSVAPDEWYSVQRLNLVIEDTDGDTLYAGELRDTDASAGSSYLWFKGRSLEQGATVRFESEDELRGVWLRGGAQTGQNVYEYRVSDGYGFTPWQTLTVRTTLQSSRAPIVTVADQTVTLRDAIPFVLGSSPGVGASTQITMTIDASDGPIQRYRFWDPAGAGDIVIDGIAIKSNTAVEVSADDLERVKYRASYRAGSELLWVQAYDGESWSAWESWRELGLRPGNQAPTIIAEQGLLERDQWMSSWDFPLFLRFADADGDYWTHMQIRDLSDADDSGYLWFGGANIAAGTIVELSEVEFALGRLWVRGAREARTDRYELRIFDGNDWSPWTSFDILTRTENRKPQVTAANSSTNIYQANAVTSLFSASDADGDRLLKFQLWDSGNELDSGYFALGSYRYPVGSEISVNPTWLDQVRFIGGSVAGTETLWARASDGSKWSDWTSWTMTTLA